ncbi:hypothetical protein SCALM49S_07911 [Streptomyces californicus]
MGAGSCETSGGAHGAQRDQARRHPPVHRGTGRSDATRKNRRNDPDRLELRKFDSATGRHVLFREVR